MISRYTLNFLLPYRKNMVPEKHAQVPACLITKCRIFQIIIFLFTLYIWGNSPLMFHILPF